MARALSNPVILTSPEKGVDGRTTLAGARAPTIKDGRIGDFWVDTTIDEQRLYGPKTAAGWPDRGLIKGNKGWTPVFAVVANGERRVQQVVDWQGGEGPKPTIGKYVGQTGFVSVIADAIDIRGPIGLTGTTDFDGLTNKPTTLSGYEITIPEAKVELDISEVDNTSDEQKVAAGPIADALALLLGNATMARTNKKLLAKADYKLLTGAALKIVCQGDSLTYGHDTTSADKIAPVSPHVQSKAPIQYPSRLQDQLVALTSSTVVVTNQGYSGDTAKLSFDRWPTKPDADVALLMLGTNDSGGVAGATYDEYCTYMERLVQRFIGWGIGVVILTPPGIEHGNTNVGPQRFGQFAKALAEAYGCPVFDGIEVQQYTLYADVYSDAVHFNKYGYAKFGDAVTAFIMSGAMGHAVRKIASPTAVGFMRGTEGIGAYRKGNTYGVTTAGSFVSTDFALSLAADGKVTLAYYLDSEASDLYVTGEVAGCVVSPCFPIDGKGINRASLKMDRQRGADETAPYTARGHLTGGKTYLGTHLGRGWKLISIAGNGAAAAFLNQVFIEPKEARLAGLKISKHRPAIEEIMVYQAPLPDATLPAGVSLDGDIIVPLPRALRGRGGDRNWFGNYGPVKVLIRAVSLSGTGTNTEGVTELVLYRAGNSNILTVEAVYKTGTNAVVPTAAGIGFSAYSATLADPPAITKTRLPTGTEQGWLYLTFASSKIGYYHIEFRSLAIEDADATAVY